MELEGLKINFLGDSITEGCGTTGKDAIFHSIMKREANLKEARNYGIGGTRIAIQRNTAVQPKDNFVDVNSFCERYDQMDDDADVVIVFGGTNDFGHGNAPIGTFMDRTPETFYGGCHYLFSKLIEKYLGKQVIIMTSLHRLGETRYINDENMTGFVTLKQYVEIIREVAEYYSLPVIDLYATSGLQPEVDAIKEKYMPDGLHPNDEGHKVLAQKILAFLKTL